jgi:hypothetical protein
MYVPRTRAALAGSFLGVAAALAAQPDPPFAENPPDGATDVPARPQLCVEVTDPDGDDVDVTFRGRRITAEPFTIVVLPDTQYYSRDNPSIFYSQTDWIVANEVARNIVFVTHVGDIVQTGSNNTQWNRAEAAMSTLEDPLQTMLPDGIAYGQAPGNHDQAPLGAPRSGGDEGGTTVNYNARFGKHRFLGRSYYGGAYDFGDPAMYPDNNDNNWQLFTAGGMDFLFLHLEYDQADSVQRDAVLAWADNLVMANEDKRVIVTSHYILHPFNFFSDQGAAIYEIFKDNPNVFLMLCGHVTEAQRRADVFEGNRIYTVLSDYQNRALGGNGWLRIMTFDPESDSIDVKTYSPWLDQFDTGAAHQFVLDYEMDGPAPYQVVRRMPNVASGSTVCAPWPGKRSGERYAWTVDVADDEGSTTGPVWSFASDGACVVGGDCADGDACTADTCAGGFCAAPAAYDGDRDGICEDVDNCIGRFNAAQRNGDGDGFGDLCDICPDDTDHDQIDLDGDGAGDICECQPADPNDREPGAIAGLAVSRVGAETAHLAWPPVAGAEAYSVSRGLLSEIGPSSYGDCLVEGLDTAALDDAELPAAGDAFFYVAQGQSFDCGLGPAGRDGDEAPRENLEPLACTGHPFTDARATGEDSVHGTPIGTYTDTLASDDVWQSIQEEVSNGSPDSRHSRLEHRWTFDVPAGSRVELHVEGFRSLTLDGDDFAFDYSDDDGSSWNAIPLVSLPTGDNEIDLVGTFAPATPGALLVRVVDTNRAPGTQQLDTVNIDELWVRSIP